MIPDYLLKKVELARIYLLKGKPDDWNVQDVIKILEEIIDASSIPITDVCPIPIQEWPKKANYAAMNLDGYWKFFEFYPKICTILNRWSSYKGESYETAKIKGSKVHWQYTLVSRKELEGSPVYRDDVPLSEKVPYTNK